MTEMNIIAPDETVELKLTAAERTAIFESLPTALNESLRIVEENYLDRIRQTPAGKPVRYTLDEIELFSSFVMLVGHGSDNMKRRNKLFDIANRMICFLEADADGPEPFNAFDSPEEADSNQFGFYLTETTSHIRLTQAQRKTLLAMDTIPGDIHKMLDVDAKGERTFDLNVRQTLAVGTAIAEAIEEGLSVKQCRQLDRIVERLTEGLIEKPAEPEIFGPTHVSHTPPASTLGYRLKITLEQTRPAIWRRLEIVDCTLDVLHELIQFAMGWENYHMHAFKVGDQLFGLPEMDDTIDESSIRLSELVQQGCKELRYWYDFGDDWWHTIKIEKEFQVTPDAKYPRCTAGARACPPEDIGGAWGYQEFLEVMADPKDERHKEMKEWCGEKFDAERFDVNKVNAFFL